MASLTDRQEALLEAVANALRQQEAARNSYEETIKKMADAQEKAMNAWTALREHQDLLAQERMARVD